MNLIWRNLLGEIFDKREEQSFTTTFRIYEKLSRIDKSLRPRYFTPINSALPKFGDYFAVVFQYH